MSIMGILSGLLAYGIGCALDPKPKYVGITEREIERRKKMGLPPLTREELEKLIDSECLDKERKRMIKKYLN